MDTTFVALIPKFPEYGQRAVSHRSRTGVTHNRKSDCSTPGLLKVVRTVASIRPIFAAIHLSGSPADAGSRMPRPPALHSDRSPTLPRPELHTAPRGYLLGRGGSCMGVLLVQELVGIVDGGAADEEKASLRKVSQGTP